MGKFRKELKAGFTTVSNDIYRDMRLDISDRGLLGTMLSLPETWNFSIKGLASILPDGEKAVRNHLRRLEEFGYLKREKIIDDNGRILDWEYIFADTPVFLEDGEKLQLEREQKKNDKELGKETIISPVVQNGHVDKPVVQKPVVPKAHVAKAVVEKGQVYIKYNKESNTNKLNTKELEIDRQIEKEVKEQIQYDHLKQKLSEEKEIELLDIIVSVLSDVYSNSGEEIRIGKEQLECSRVIDTFKELEEKHIEYVIHNVLAQNKKIVNVYSYLMKSLFTAPKSFNLSKYSKTKKDLPDWYSQTDSTPPSKEMLANVLELQRKLKEGTL